MATPHPEMIDPTRYGSLGELLADALVTFKTETALIEVDRKKESRRLTYLDAKREADRVTRWLAARGVGAGDRVAIVMSNQSRWLLAACAVFARGAVLVPLDYKLSADEQEALMAHCRPKALITEHGLARRFGALDVEAALVTEAKGEYAFAHTDWDALDADGETPAPVARAREDAATIVYSSGTGGRPKGCVLSHEAYLEQLKALMALFPMRVGHRTFSILPTNHAIDFMVGFVGPFSCGATVVHQRSLRPEFLQSTMQSYGVTHMALVPMVLEAFERSIEERLLQQPAWARRMVGVIGGLNEMLTTKQPTPKLSRALLSPIHEAFGGELEVLFCGGAFVDRDRAELFYRLGLPVVIGYGLTECCTVATVNDLKPFRGDSVGRPVPGVQVRIHEPGADGVGEVWIRGRTLMTGYLDDPELTAEAITEDGWLRTGDLGWMDAAHHLHLVGRSKNMIVTEGGKNVYPEDIEGAFEALPVEELAVFASGFLWPEQARLGHERLVAVVRRKKGNGTEPASDGEIRAQLAAKNRRLPEHKRIRGLVFVDEAFPRTASMKVKRQLLAESLRAAAPEEERLS
ncbi:MAG: AMP-binding protein [Myxococcota bacterium]|nr:AMP-binding protein [Myxococcota bacterium]